MSINYCGDPPAAAFRTSSARSPCRVSDTHAVNAYVCAALCFSQDLYAYLVEKMGTVAPNLATLIGETVAARLISKVTPTADVK